MTNAEIKDSLATCVASKVKVPEPTFKVEHRVSTIKEYKNSDLPVYFRWYSIPERPWYYRARIKDGILVADLLQTTDEGIEYKYSTISCVFNEDNTEVTEELWRNNMHKFIAQLRD